MRAVKVAGRVFSQMLTVILAVMLLANLYAIGARYFTDNPQPTVFGWSWAVVISGSMEPEIGVNDLVVVHEEDSYAVGDVITYRSGSSVVTHRIIDQTEQGFTTKGDSNNTEDSQPVSLNAVIGKVAYVIPNVGLYIAYLRTPLGMTCLVLIGILLIEIPYLVDKFREEKRQGGCS